MEEDVVIKVSNLTKEYFLYDKNIDQLKEIALFGQKSYHKCHMALDDVSFDVKKGENVGIIGTNGSGKSTLLKILTGVVKATQGDSFIKGKVSALLELGAGFNPNYTGIENIYLNGTIMGFSREEVAKKLNDIVEFADIGEFINQPVKNYSSGMFARLAFAVAINVDPDILIVDEALSVGDIFFQAKCYRKFEEFKKLGKTILFVSHDMGSVSKYCDKTILLNKGKVVKIGKPKDVINLYKKILVNEHNAERKSNGNNDVVAADSALDNDNNVVYRDMMNCNPKALDYGTKAAEIIDFAIFDEDGLPTSTIETGTETTIMIKVRFNETIANPIFAYTIKDVMGLDLVGTNTMFEGIDMGTVHEGEIRTVRFKQPLCLQGGDFLLSLGCTGYYQEEFIVYSRLYDVCTLTVVNDRKFVGKWNANSVVEVE